MNRIFLFLLIILLSAFSIQEKGPVWRVISSGKNSGCEKRKSEVYYTKKQYLKAWLELRKGDASLPAQPPAVDFKKKLIVACYDGSESNGLEADSLWIRDGALVVRLSRMEMQANCRDAKLLVTPYVLIETERSGWNILKKQERVTVIKCD